MGTETKDGVTLIAEAIRKERQAKAEAEAKRQVTTPNVSEVTAQFVKATPTPATSTDAGKGKTEPQKVEEPKAEVTESQNEE